jgi:isoleucyl-tRNA synthetase
MSKVYKEYKQLNLPEINKEILEFWKVNDTFQKSISTREGKKEYTFYEGPPSANGMPGIHHVMARAIKDIFCRFKTLQGYKVQRKAGWDTHGLPIELQVEKELGITKEDIGTKISVDEYNAACRKSVMKFTDKWNALTEQMGYWVDMSDPYITYENEYIESVWWLLGEFYKKDLLYKGYTIQPYSPAAGTGLSSHELNQPGTYKPVKDTTIVAQFKAIDGQKIKGGVELPAETFFLAWTTTPWTLPSNTALAVGKNIDYVLIKTFNPYTADPIHVIMAKDLAGKYFATDNENADPFEFTAGDKKLPYSVVSTFKGTDVEGLKYEQLLPYAKPDGDAFRVIIGDFVSTEDGTGIVHIAPSHGADDFRTAKQNNIGAILLVDKQGRFTSEVTDMAGEYVKEEYLKEIPKDYKNVDVRIAIKLKESNRAFKVEKYEHTYPHCWRTDKPVLYYPMDSWFIKTTAIKDKLIALNKTINWKPESTGTGRFGNWLENLVDWNLSRSRYWGVPLPIWRTEDGTEEICINSIESLRTEIERSIAAGFMKTNPYAADKDFDVHRPYVDDVILISATGKQMFREKDLIDVWFDSGAMPYAQQHYPFENREAIDGKKTFPADFIAEGVDQTRGWFFTLHVIAVAIFDSVAYKTVVSNGLVLDKSGQKMSKRLGNAVDPFMAMDTYGADALRWYMITNAEPWDNLKFDMDGVVEVQRKFFGTLYNTYSFFALYANVDEFKMDEKNVIPVKDRPEFDQWIISELQTLIKEVTAQYEDYNPTKAARPIQDFVTDTLSNWYVRLSRRRFWKGELTHDKLSAYQTLYECLMVVSQLMSPVSPFFAEWLYKNLSDSVREEAMKNQTPLASESVHLSNLTKAEDELINEELEKSMHLAQRVTSLILSLRKKHRIRVRQPLQKIMIPVLDPAYKKAIEKVQELIRNEVNVKEISFLENDEAGILVKKIKPDFKKLGPKYGKLMKEISAAVGNFGQTEIATIERVGTYELQINNEQVIITREDVEIASEDIPGWLVANDNELTVALDITLTPELTQEGVARDIVNRVQNLRKDRDYKITDRIKVKIQAVEGIEDAVKSNMSYICNEVLADKLEVMEKLDVASAVEIELEDNLKTMIEVSLV